MLPEVVGIGMAVSDHVVKVDHFPRVDETLIMSAESWQFGGKAATAMAALGRLKVPCAMMCVLGDDADGYANIEDYQYNGVDVSYVTVDPDFQTQSCIAVADSESGGRFFLGANSHFRTPEPKDLNQEAIENAKYVLLHQADAAAKQAADWIHAQGGQVVFDADVYEKPIELFMDHIDIFIASEIYIEERYPDCDMLECCRSLCKQGPHTVIITLGSKGCVGCSGEGEFRLPAFKVPVMDTTGAGDVFHGGFIYGKLQGWTDEESARWASAMSAIKCTSIGGRSGLPTREMVEQFLKDGSIDQAVIQERVQHYSRLPYGENSSYLRSKYKKGEK